jgi:hypothetical protein
MKRAAFLLLGWVLLLSLISANADATDVCASPEYYRALNDPLASTGGIGGTGHATDGTPNGGIGGTGRSGENEPGEGGEGGIGGTGIIGTITGFASICVNGVEVHYDDAVPVSENGKPTTTRSLAVGQVVAVEARNSARGLEARGIAVVHALEGPVSRPADAQGQIEVMGARVALASETLRQQARQLKQGDWVQVGGHGTTAGNVMATYVTRIAPRDEVSASGRADAASRRVGGVAVSRVTDGELTVRGQWDGQRINIRESHPQAGTEWSSRLSRVIIETRVRQRDGGIVRTGRHDIDKVLADREDRRGDERLEAGALIRITARVDRDGTLHPTRIERAERAGRAAPTNGEGANGNRHSDAANKERRSDDERPPKEGHKSAEREERPSDKTPRNERDAAERNERAERERTDRTERTDRAGRAERPDRPERSERSGRDH